jgi:hypothetical protein
MEERFNSLTYYVKLIGRLRRMFRILFIRGSTRIRLNTKLQNGIRVDLPAHVVAGQRQAVNFLLVPGMRPFLRSVGRHAMDPKTAVASAGHS